VQVISNLVGWYLAFILNLIPGPIVDRATPFDGGVSVLCDAWLRLRFWHLVAQTLTPHVTLRRLWNLHNDQRIAQWNIVSGTGSWDICPRGCDVCNMTQNKLRSVFSIASPTLDMKPGRTFHMDGKPWGVTSRHGNNNTIKYAIVQLQER
jgi:hypothetical protein